MLREKKSCSYLYVMRDSEGAHGFGVTAREYIE